MKMKTNRLKVAVLMIISGLGLSMLLFADKLSLWRSPQVTAYNRGLSELKEGKLDEALHSFDESLDAYASMSQSGFFSKLVYPVRSTELAALAQSKKALAYWIKQNAEQTVQAFKDSLILNPGEQDEERLRRLTPGENLSWSDAVRLSEQSAVVKHNLEVLLKSDPSLSQAQGKGKPKPGGKDGKEGNEPGPGNKPGPGSGKSNPNAI